MSRTYEEMKQQYSALRKTFEYMASKKDRIIEFFKSNAPKSLTYIGCGSGYCLCQSGEISAKLRLGMPANALASGDLMLNYKSYSSLLEGTIIIAPSRSGSTSEVVRAIENVKTEISVPVLAISCVKDSELSKKADFALELPWAFDESVCQTRTVVNLYTADLLILAYVSGDDKLVKDIEKAIELGSEYMNRFENSIKEIAGLEWSEAVLLADGEMQGIAAEAAIAFTEIAQIPGRYYHLLDLRHGPMVLVNKESIVVACITSNNYETQKALVCDALSRGAKVITYSDVDLGEIEGVSLQVTSGTELDHAVRGIPFIFISQALACYKADNLGINPDNPDGIVAWVKL